MDSTDMVTINALAAGYLLLCYTMFLHPALHPFHFLCTYATKVLTEISPNSMGKKKLFTLRLSVYRDLQWKINFGQLSNQTHLKKKEILEV